MNGWSCSLKDGPVHFTMLTTFFVWMVWSFSKTFELMVGLCSPKHGPVPFTVLKNVFVWMLNHQVDGWAALPNIPCHGPAHFAALKNRFVLVLCRHSTTFKWTDNRAPLNTVQVISRCWKTISSGWYEVFQKHSNLWLGRVLPNTAQFFSRCWKVFSYGCYAAV